MQFFLFSSSPFAFSVLLTFHFLSFLSSPWQLWTCGSLVPEVLLVAPAARQTPGSRLRGVSSHSLLESVPTISPLSLGLLSSAGLGKWELLTGCVCESVSQHFSPRTQVWGETLGEDVEEALSFPRLEIRRPQGQGAGGRRSGSEELWRVSGVWSITVVCIHACACTHHWICLWWLESVLKCVLVKS